MVLQFPAESLDEIGGRLEDRQAAIGLVLEREGVPLGVASRRFDPGQDSGHFGDAGGGHGDDLEPVAAEFQFASGPVDLVTGGGDEDAGAVGDPGEPLRRGLGERIQEPGSVTQDEQRAVGVFIEDLGEAEPELVRRPPLG